jgi:fructokinase
LTFYLAIDERNAMTMRPVLALGECLIDLIAVEQGSLATASTLAIREGGAPMNVAVGLARLGVPSAFCSVVGTDPFGDRLLSIMRANNVDTTHVHTTDATETSIAYAWRDDRGDGHFRLLRQADALLDPAMATTAVTSLQPAAIVIGSVSTATETSRTAILAAIAAASPHGSRIVVDLNVRISQWPSVAPLRHVLQDLLRDATLIKLSVDDARAAWNLTDPGAIRSHVRQWSDAQMVITDGSRGVVIFHAGADEAQRYPVFPVAAVEPTGAGDAFLAGTIARLIASGWLPLTTGDVAFAMAAGALATTRAGALTALPTADEIAAFLAEMRDRSGTLPA